MLLLKPGMSKESVVPLSLRLDSENRIILVSGPNAGGKSVTLKTVGLLQVMPKPGAVLLPTRLVQSVTRGRNAKAGPMSSAGGREGARGI